MSLRKQVYDLSLEDLEEYQKWEFCTEEEGEDVRDESAVRPYQGEELPSGIFVVKAAFMLADGGSWPGNYISGTV